MISYQVTRKYVINTLIALTDVDLKTNYACIKILLELINYKYYMSTIIKFKIVCFVKGMQFGYKAALSRYGSFCRLSDTKVDLRT